jgi:hypothetical protein
MLATLIFIAGIAHFGILIASALVPQVLDWRSSLAKLDPLLRQLIWVHGAFIVLVIVAFGALSLVYAGELASGDPLSRGVAAFVAIFWGARLAVQFFVFDAKPHLRSIWLRVGYHGLTVVFAFIAAVFAVAAIDPTLL